MLNKSILYLIYFCVYAIVILLYGKSGIKNTHTRSEFYLGDKKIGLKLGIATFIATWFSAASILSYTANIYFYGYYSILYSLIPWFVGLLMLYIIIVPIRKFEVNSISEFFEARYDSIKMKQAASLMTVIIFTLYIIIQIQGLGLVTSRLLGIEYSMAILLIYILSVFTAFGGFHSVSKTDGFNLIITIISIVVAVIVVRDKLGFDLQWLSIVDASAKEISNNYNIFLSEGSLAGNIFLIISIVSVFFGWGIGLAVNPQYIVRLLAAKSDITAKKTIVVSSLILVFMYIGITILGYSGHGIESSARINLIIGDDYLIEIIDSIFYTKYSPMILMGIVACVVSTTNSQLLIVSSSLCNELLKNYTDKFDEDKFISFNRLVIFLAATIGIFFSSNSFEYSLIFGSHLWGIMASSFFVPLYGGLLSKSISSKGAYVGMIGGFISNIIFIIINSLHFTPLHPSFLGVSVSFLLCYIIGKNEKKLGGNNDEI